MTDEWLSTTIATCREQHHLETVAVNRLELLKRLQQLEWYAQYAARVNEAARKAKDYTSPDGVSRCGGIPQAACKCAGIRMVMQNGRCWHCEGKVTS